MGTGITTRWKCWWAARSIERTGMVCDLAELDGLVGREVLEPFDHQNLNTLESFRAAVPTTENLVLEIRKRLAEGAAAEIDAGGAGGRDVEQFF